MIYFVSLVFSCRKIAIMLNCNFQIALKSNYNQFIFIHFIRMWKISKVYIQFIHIDIPVLEKVVDWTLIRANQSYSESLRTNPKKRFVSRLMKNDQKSIRLNLRHQSEWIRARINLNRIFNLNKSEPLRH